MDGCLFCKIVAGEIPATKIYEDDIVLAFLDIHPVNIGHTIIVPKTHNINIYNTPEDTMCHIMRVAKKLSVAIKIGVEASGINIEMNNEPIAGQIILHTHLHIVPRFRGDGFLHWRGARDYYEGEQEATSLRIKTHL